VVPNRGWKRNRGRDIETIHFSLTPISAETFRKIDFSFRSPGKRSFMRWSALEAAADPMAANAASSGIDSPQ
jgi:hypothetical protein